jgi:hypothetical protein
MALLHEITSFLCRLLLRVMENLSASTVGAKKFSDTVARRTGVEAPWYHPLYPALSCGLFFFPEDGNSRFLQNDGKYSSDYSASHPRKLSYIYRIFPVMFCLPMATKNGKE